MTIFNVLLIILIITIGITAGTKLSNILDQKERTKKIELCSCILVVLLDCVILPFAYFTSGGVKTSEIDPKTMESKKTSGLYFAGEIIDCDAYTGGFNLQIAWATAYAAGLAVSSR